MRPQTNTQQRDKLVGDLRLRKNPDGLAEAEERLRAYLQEHRMRQTPERLFILRKVYQLSGPIDTETLHGLLEMEHNIVSLQTIYNTLALLSDIGLVSRVQLIQGGMAFYERALHREPHGYMVCRKCCKIAVIRRPQMLREIDSGIPATFRIEQVSFTVFGLCRKCQQAERKAQLREMKRRERSHRPAATAPDRAAGRTQETRTPQGKQDIPTQPDTTREQ